MSKQEWDDLSKTFGQIKELIIERMKCIDWQHDQLIELRKQVSLRDKKIKELQKRLE